MMKQKKKQKQAEESVQAQSFEPDVEQVPSVISDDFTLSSKGKTMTVDFESLRKLEKDQAVSDYDVYQDLLRKLSRGEESPDNPAILPLLERVGRSVDQLEEDYQWRVRRDKEIAIVKEGPALEAEKAELNERLGEMYAKVREAEKKYREESWPLEVRLNEIKEKLHWVMVHKIRLPNDCRDDNLHRRLEELGSRRTSSEYDRSLMDQSERLRRDIEDAQRKIKEMPFCSNRKERINDLKSEIKDMQHRWEMVQEQLETIRRTDAEISQESAAIHELMIYA